MKQSEIQKLLKTRLATIAKVPVAEINVNRPLADFGLDSVAAVNLSTELEDRFHINLPATLVWDYPTIAALSQHIAEKILATRSESDV